MVWIIIAGIFIVAFGPLLWLRPSARERRLARIAVHDQQQQFCCDGRCGRQSDVAAHGDQWRQPPPHG